MYAFSNSIGAKIDIEKMADRRQIDSLMTLLGLKNKIIHYKRDNLRVIIEGKKDRGFVIFVIYAYDLLP